MIEKRLEDEDLVPAADEESAPPEEDGPLMKGRSRPRVPSEDVEPRADEALADAPLPEESSGFPEGPPGDDEAIAGEDRAATESLVPLEGSELRRAVEAILFSLSEPIAVRALSEVVGASVHDVREAIEALRLEYLDQCRAFRIEDIAGGVQILTLRAYDPWIRKLRAKQREGRLSGAALETLAVIAYKQPINRAELEAIRGVNCGPILKTLLDRGLVKVVGRGEGLGKPLLYGTTKRFLESFGIASIRDLPQPEAEGPSVAPRAGDEDEGRDLFEGRDPVAVRSRGGADAGLCDLDSEPPEEPGGRSLLEEERIEAGELLASGAGDAPEEGEAPGEVDEEDP